MTRYWTGYGYMNSSEGLPANKPPWSTLTAYDLNQGTIKWQIPLGSVTELAAKGIKDTGSFWPRSGVVVTAGGLIFSGQLLLDLAAAGMSREDAYSLVQTHAMRAWKEGLTFRDEIARDPAITSRLTPAQLAAAFDYTRQLANVDAIFTRVLGE